MSSDSESRRAGANITVNLSTQLMTGSLAILAIEGALVTFVLEKRDPGLFFYVAAALGFVLFVLSIYCGGQGVSVIQKRVYRDYYPQDPNDPAAGTKSRWFQAQTLLLMFGLFALVGAVLSGGPASDDTKGKAVTRYSITADSRIG
jgi:hypothetical protein